MLLRLIAWLNRLAGLPAPPEPQAASAVTRPVIPAADGGMVLLDADALLESQRGLLARIKLCYGSDAQTFASDILAPVRRYAEYVNVLPATSEDYFIEPGGLLRLGLETAFFALQATDAQIFAGRETITNRRHLEPRWRQATFIAGLCSELHRTLSMVEVRNASGKSWQPYLGGISQWLPGRAPATLRIRWRSIPEVRALGLFALPHVVSSETLRNLAQDNDVIVPQLLATLAGAAGYYEHNVMEHLVRHAAALVIDRDLRVRHGDAARRKPQPHLARYLLGAMRELLLTQTSWQPNTPKSRLWHGRDGLFLVWPNALADVLSYLHDGRLAGVPASPSVAATILARAGFLQRLPDDTLVWQIRAPDGSEPLHVLRFSAPEVLLRVLVPEPAPLPQALLESERQAGGATAGTRSEPSGDAPAVGDQVMPPAREAMQGSSGQQLPLPEMPPAEGAEAPKAAPVAQDKKNVARKPKGHPRSGHKARAPSCLSVRWCLQAPLRLQPDVARALAKIVGSQSEPRYADNGAMFIRFAQLIEQGINTDLAARALASAGMIAAAPDALADARESTGLWLDKRFLVREETPFGSAPPTAGESDAAASV